MIRSIVVTFFRSEELDTRSSDNKNASTAQQFMSGGSGFLPCLSLNNRQHLVQLKSSFLDNLTLWLVCSKLRHMGPYRTQSEDAVWLKFPSAPQLKDLPQVKLNAC